MRYIIHGAGAVGCVVGARLQQAGHEVVLIGRGAHLAAMQRDGLRLLTPNEDSRLAVTAVGHPRDVTFRPDDVVLLTMKTQDTAAALLDLELAGAEVAEAIVSCQNGVENERLIARRFARVYGMVVFIPATYLEPGTVIGEAVNPSAVLDIGCYPDGLDATAAQIAADISGARMLSRTHPRIMEHKYAKLVGNLGNGAQAITGQGRETAGGKQINDLMRAEALACFAAAGIAATPDAEFRTAVASPLHIEPVNGQRRGGGSTWQSLMRGAGSVEVDYLNGEIVLLGALHGVPTPANAVIRRLTNQMAATGAKPGVHTPEDVLAMIEAEGHGR